MDPSFWDRHGSEVIVATITMVIAVVLAFAIDRLVIARATRVAARVSGVGDLGSSRATQTRLRVVRRLVFVMILVIGAGLALSQFTNLDKLAAGLLASSAVLGLVIGFAAQHTLANLVAGIMIAVNQPIRIGDTVTLDDTTGRVDDLTLAYTYLDTGDGRLMVIPNETVASSVIFNHSTGDRSAPARVSVWVAPAADLDEARRVLKPAGVSDIQVAEITREGVRIELKGSGGHESTRVGDEEAVLRERAHEALRAAGLLNQ